MLKVLQVALCLVLASGSARAQSIAGDWMGTLDAGPIKLRLVFHITENEKGLAATLDSVDQNAKGLAVSSVTLSGSAVKLELPQIGAINHANLPLLAYLLKRGANVHTHTGKSTSPLESAVAKGCIECLRILREAGADLNERDEEGRSLLHNAAGRGEADIVTMLLKSGARADIEASDGYTALQVAAARGQMGSVALLLQHHADPNVITDTVGPPLYLAVQFGHREVAAFLVKAGARWDLSWRGYTPLRRAAWQNDAVSVGLMLDAGADPSVPSDKMPPPLMVAAERGNVEVMKVLLDRGAEINLRHGQLTAVGAARLRQHQQAIDFLVSRGAR